MQSLPEEIISHIGATTEFPSSLARLARVSRQLHRICTPLLYTHIAIQSPNRTPHRQPLLSLPKCMEVLRLTLHRRPDLAGIARSLTLRFAWSNLCSPTSSSRRNYSKGDAAPAANDLAAIITLLPNLDRFDCGLSGAPQKFYSSLFKAIHLRRRSCESSHLKEILLADFAAITSDGNSPTWENETSNDNPRGISGSVSYFVAGAVELCMRAFDPERLLLFRLTGYRGDMMEGPDTHPPLRVKHLELRQSHLHTEQMDQLLMSCHSLETFILQSLPRWYGEKDTARTILSKKHHQSLKHLCLIGEGPLLQFPPGLKEFSALEHLKICPAAVSFVECKYDSGMLSRALPLNLKRLSIVDFDYNIHTSRALESLQQLLNACHIVTPHLRQIDVEGSPGDYYDMLLACYRQARSSDIDFRVIETEVSSQIQNPNTEPGRAWGMDEDAPWPEIVGAPQKRRVVIDMESQYILNAARTLEEVRLI